MLANTCQMKCDSNIICNLARYNLTVSYISTQTSRAPVAAQPFILIYCHSQHQSDSCNRTPAQSSSIARTAFETIAMSSSRNSEDERPSPSPPLSLHGTIQANEPTSSSHLATAAQALNNVLYGAQAHQDHPSYQEDDSTALAPTQEQQPEPAAESALDGASLRQFLQVQGRSANMFIHYMPAEGKACYNITQLIY